MNLRTVGVAIVGCGNIAEKYAERLRTYPQIRLLGFSDLAPERARAFAEKFGGTAYPDLTAALADPAVALIVNLTIHHAHVEVITRCLHAGKHVHTEKPLSMSVADADQLIALAQSCGLRLSSAPITYLGEAQQTAWKLLREGKLGQVRLAYAEVNHGRIERWHPNPAPFYDVGVAWDVAIYPLTLLTTFFGPARQVRAWSQMLLRERKTQAGEVFQITTPDFFVAMVEFASGVTLRLTANFYVTASKQGTTVELHGDDGHLFLGSPWAFDAPLELAAIGGKFETVPMVRPAYAGVEFARGVAELADAILAGRPHRASPEHARHVIEIIAGIERSCAREGETISLQTTFVPSAPMEWATGPVA
jgi:predicted dehydrogenase